MHPILHGETLEFSKLQFLARDQIPSKWEQNLNSSLSDFEACALLNTSKQIPVVSQKGYETGMFNEIYINTEH